MRVLFLLPQPFFRERGSSIRALRQIEVLSEGGHEVDLVCFPFGKDIVLPGLTLQRVARPPGIRDVVVGPSLSKLPLDVLLLLRAAALCRKNRYAVIQAVEEATFLGVALARRHGCRLIYNMESHLSDHLRYSGFAPARPFLRVAESLERRAMRAADYVVTVGPILSEVVRAEAPAARVLQLDDAPAQERFTEDRAGAARLRAELGLGEGPVAVYTGNFIGYQGVDLLVRAAGRVANRMPEARIVLAGGTPSDVAAMRRLADAAGAARTCVFAGSRPASEMAAFLTMADALLSPRTLGMNPPLKIYPYMQSGRVVVATRLPTHTQVVDDTCAVLADAEPAGFGDAIVRALRDRSMAATLAGAARLRLETRHSLRIFRDKARAMYADLASRA